MLQNDNLVLACFIVEVFFWTCAYVLIIRRSFLEQIHGMPVAAMCGNISWEILLSLGVFPACPIYWVSCQENAARPITWLAPLVDGVILFTVVRFGRAQFQQPFIRKYFLILVGAGVAIGFALNYLILRTVFLENVLADTTSPHAQFLTDGALGGILSGWVLAFIMSILFVALILSRNSVQGQTVYIAVFMAIGNLFAYLFDASTGIHVPSLINVLAVASLMLNVVYVVMVYRKTIELGLDPLRRI